MPLILHLKSMIHGLFPLLFFLKLKVRATPLSSSSYFPLFHLYATYTDPMPLHLCTFSMRSGTVDFPGNILIPVFHLVVFNIISPANQFNSTYKRNTTTFILAPVSQIYIHQNLQDENLNPS